MSNLLLDEKPLVILPELAVQVGLNEAIVLQQIHYWLKKDKVGKVHDGRKWIRNTYEEWQENFPFWSESTVRRAINKLRDAGLVLVARLNKKAYDKTNWYSIDYDRLLKMTRATVQNDQSDLVKMDRPIPETTTETTSDNPKGAQAPDLPHNLNDWIQFVKDGHGQPGGMTARLGRMFATLYPDYEPDYGRIGAAAKRVKGARRLAHLCWLSQAYRVTGDPVDYCEAMEKNKTGGSNGRDRSATQQDHNTPSPEELEELKRLVREDKAKRESVP